MSRRNTLKCAAEDISPIKTRLLDVVRNLQADGLHREAEGLDRLIFRLEAHQIKMLDRANRLLR